MAEPQKSSKENPIPEAFFHAIAFVLPGLNQVAQECDISIGEWIILWHVRQAGVPHERNQLIILRQTLTELLGRRGFGEANLTRLLNSLADKDLMRRVSLKQSERDQLFGTSDGGSRLAVILQASGEKKIQMFMERLVTRFAMWRSEQSVMVQKALASASGVSLQVAEWFFKRLPDQQT